MFLEQLSKGGDRDVKGVGAIVLLDAGVLGNA
jgi:hypothetical protein